MYGVDLLDLWRGKLSLRKVRIYLDGLPRNCALSRAVDANATAWSLTDHLLAELLHSSRTANWQRSDGKTPPPPRIARPGVEDEQEQAKAVSEQRARAFLARQKMRAVN